MLNEPLEFKKLSDVEVVAEPTETANVLIEEDGVIKKAPKTAVGGAGGGTHYICIDENGNVNAPDGIYEEIIEKLFNNFIGIDVRVFKRGSYVTEFPVTGYTYSLEEEKIQVDCEMGMSVYLYKNGEHSYYWD